MDDSKLILVTGSTDGIGKETATQLAKDMDNKIIVHGRDVVRCQNTVIEIKMKTQNKNIEYIVCDFKSLKNIQNMVQELKDRKLSIIVCNAGVLSPNLQFSDDGYELSFAVNHLSHFLLVNSLIKYKILSPSSRIVIVSSICYTWENFGYDYIVKIKPNEYEKYVQYSKSKLANHCFAIELNSRLNQSSETSNISVCVCEPGIVDTKLLHAGGYNGGESVLNGSRSSVFLSICGNIKEKSGKYFNNKCRIQKIDESRVNTENCRILWELSGKCVSKFF